MDTRNPYHWLIVGMMINLVFKIEAANNQISKEFDLFHVEYRTKIQATTNRTLSSNTIRKRRYIRFPTGPSPSLSSAGYILEGSDKNVIVSHPMQRFLPFPTWRQHKSLWKTPSADYSRSPAVMAHRTPRLIFRDNDFFLPAAGSGSSSQVFSTNQLPEFEEDLRGKFKISQYLQKI